MGIVTRQGDSGSATVEQTGIVLVLVAALALLAGVYLSGGNLPGRGIGVRIANRIACGPRATEACRRHPAVSAYGWDVARAVRLLAPPPAAAGPAGGPALVPVDFRYCQRPSCAVPRAGSDRLTTANRRTTLFTRVEPLGGSAWRITYWMYRPSLGWEAIRRVAGPAEIEAASGTRLLLRDSPRLVPLEILPGRNHYELPAGDEPPWRWRIGSIHPGRSA